jgi:hippurate hydrolase
MFHGGTADNVIPQSVQLDGTVRTLNEDVRVLVEERLARLVEQTAAAFGAKATFSYRRNYPVLVNHEKQALFAGDVASEIVGEANVNRDLVPMMGGEDFAFMLNERPGAFIWVGNGPSAGLHHPKYNFNDDAIPFGTSYWVRLVETALR